MKIVLAIATSLALLIPATAHGLGFCGSCGATPASQCGYADTLWTDYCNQPTGCGGAGGCGAGGCGGVAMGANPTWWHGFGGCGCGGNSCGLGRTGCGFSGLGHTGFGGCGRRGGYSGMGLGCGQSCGYSVPSYTMDSCGCGDSAGCDDIGWSAPVANYGFGQRHRCAAPSCGCGQSRMGLRQLFSRWGAGRNSGMACSTGCDFPSASYAPGEYCGSGGGCGAEGNYSDGSAYSTDEQSPHPADPQSEGQGVPGVMETPVEDATPIQESPMYEDGMSEGPIQDVQPMQEAAPTEAGDAINPTNADALTPLETETLPEAGNKEAKRRPTPSRRWNIQG